MRQQLLLLHRARDHACIFAVHHEAGRWQRDNRATAADAKSG
jgi:hypothetical protein